MQNEERKNKRPSSELYLARRKEEHQKRLELREKQKNKEKGGLTLQKAKNSWTKSKEFKEVYKGPTLYQSQHQVAKNLENYFSTEEWRETPVHELEEKLLRFVKEELNSSFERRAMEEFLRYINGLQRKNDNVAILESVCRELRTATLKDRNASYRSQSEKG